ncbi:MAG: hypothetical protein IPJ88_04640 [Myxococcales bacterium]|nr:MAG: hypothetical protein IPJ88_04640 [Myxococcales bacterium]
MSDSIKASEARIPTSLYSRVAYQGLRARITRRGQEALYLISEQDMRLLEALEDRIDGELAQKALDEMKAKGEKAISWDELKTETDDKR